MINLQFILYKFFVNVIGIGFSAFLFKHVEIKSFSALIISGLVLFLANVFIKPLLIIITLPLQIISMGLFYFIINAVIVLIVSSLVNGFIVDGLWTAIGVSLTIGFVNLIFDIFYNKPNIHFRFRRF
ncbi:MAG: phage holin family protein [Calditerrivibrio sp.]|nr:phage holin family protein [Calditerrivibrio sp.]MCA1932038.1 phage holin family protein [Calditerrivibrio sp.]